MSITRISTLPDRTSRALHAPAPSDRAVDRLIRAATILLFVLLGLLVAFSLTWKFEHDSPIMMYIAFLLERLDFVPYRDVFDVNLPGAYLSYSAIGRLVGYTDIGGRFADLIVLAAILAINWRWLRRVSPRAAWLGSALWGALYLGLGPFVSLQREHLMLLPLVGSVALASNHSMTGVARNLTAGLCLGLAATVKLQVLIGFPMIVLASVWADEERRTDDQASGCRVIQTVWLTMLGGSIPFILVAIYLWAIGALSAFVSLATNYWPLYTSLDGSHRKQTGLGRLAYAATHFREIGSFGLWLAPAAMGAFVALYQSTRGTWQRRQVRLMVGLVASYSLYTVPAGSFWQYHWLPFLFFTVQVAALCVVEQPSSAPTGRLVFPLVVLALTVVVMFPVSVTGHAVTWRPLTSRPESRRAGEIADFLRARLGEGDTVQPLDWTGGATHALLISRARIATPFVYDFHFYHDVSTPYIQELKKQFLTAMDASRPRFVVEVTAENKPWVSGDDTTRTFEELRLLLDNNYRVVAAGDGYRIYEAVAHRNGGLR